MEREFDESFRSIETKTPKDLVREYETLECGKVREYGPFVYGYSMTTGPDGKPKVREFGNVKSQLQSRSFSRRTHMISSEMEPLADVTATGKEVKVIMEMPGVSKENIRVNIYDSSVQVSTVAFSIFLSKNVSLYSPCFWSFTAMKLLLSLVVAILAILDEDATILYASIGLAL